MEKIRFIDLFCGLGGFRLGFEQACHKYKLVPECVLSSDIDPNCQMAYEANFGELPQGDITKIREQEVPDHDVLLAGFPCQAFSIAGKMRGFEDTRGTLFFDLARILNEKKPKAFILENVKQLVGHDKGNTLKAILQTLKDLGYHVQHSVLNALDYGLPQKGIGSRFVTVIRSRSVLSSRCPRFWKQRLTESTTPRRPSGRSVWRNTSRRTILPSGMKTRRATFARIRTPVHFGRALRTTTCW
jgi:DNA-cytosine methyltransferase